LSKGAADNLSRLRGLLAESSGQPVRLVVGQREADVPEAVVDLLADCVQALAENTDVSVVPRDRLLTTQAAAELLNVSRPYLVRLLDEGAIPHTRTGTHRRIFLADVLEYKKKRDARRRTQLRGISRLGQSLDTQMSEVERAAS
jgi:excisionase family DNA binding protein